MTQHDPQNPDHIRPGQVWTTAHPMDDITVRVVSIGAGRVSVIDAHTGQRPRQIWAERFHASPWTKSGKPHKWGYILTSDTPEENDQ